MAPLSLECFTLTNECPPDFSSSNVHYCVHFELMWTSFSKKKNGSTFRVSHGLKPDSLGRSVGHDLGPNKVIIFLY